MLNSQPSQTPKLVGAVVITAVLMIGVYVLILQNKPAGTTSSNSLAPTSSSSAGQSDAPSTSSPSSSSSDTSAATYRDGTYSATASYQVPHDTNQIKVTLTIKNGLIADVSDQHSYEDHESARYISDFDEGLSGAIVGKKLDAAQLSRLNGASDTAEGFNEALATIIQQAKA